MLIVIWECCCFFSPVLHLVKCVWQYANIWCVRTLAFAQDENVAKYYLHASLVRSMACTRNQLLFHSFLCCMLQRKPYHFYRQIFISVLKTDYLKPFPITSSYYYYCTTSKIFTYISYVYCFKFDHRKSLNICFDIFTSCICHFTHKITEIRLEFLRIQALCMTTVLSVIV